MSTISIRDLSATKELDQRAMTEVKGGMSPQQRKHRLYPVHMNIVDTSKWTSQFQNAHISNTAVGQAGPKGGSNVFNQFGTIGQTQIA